QMIHLALGERRSDRWSDTAEVATSSRALCAERSRLEQHLTARSTAFRTIQGRVRVGSADIRSALPKGTALVDLVDYRHLQVAMELDETPGAERMIVAFVIRPDRREVGLVSLGSTPILAELIGRWRATYGTGRPPRAGGKDPGVELRERLWD